MIGDKQTEVLIVGAGPTGLTLACLCYQLGIRTMIIEKNSGPSRTSKAIGLQYRVSEILAILGIADRFIRAGGSPTPVNIYHGARKLVTFHFDLGNHQSGKDAFVPRPILIPQSQTEKLLGDRLQELGGSILWNCELLTFFQGQDQVSSKVRLSDGKEEWIHSQYLVSCEGAHSVIRKVAGISFKGKTYPLAFVIADIEIDWPLDHNENHVWMHRDGSFAALPLPTGENKWRLFFEISGDAPPLGEVTLSQIQQLIAERTGRNQLQVSNPEWLSEFRLNCRMVNRFRSNRVFLAGDAAHVHSPTGGQGITTGVQDAINLAWKLGRVLKGAPDSLLDTYEFERLPKVKEVLYQTNRITTVFFAAEGPMRALRDYIILPVLRLKVMQKRMFDKLSQLHVNYRESSLSQEEQLESSPKLRSGDRTPDVVFESNYLRKRISLFELLQKHKPVILIGCERKQFPDDLVLLIEVLIKLDTEPYVLTDSLAELVQNVERCLMDPFGDFAKIYDLKGDFLLFIRPDGHIGLSQKPINVKSLKNYFKKISSHESVEKEFQMLKNRR
jgi:2-polyprenyl-6-methoxyphenol hydroxylase-like FAD-dependent oxidoreductase